MTTFLTFLFTFSLSLLLTWTLIRTYLEEISPKFIFHVIAIVRDKSGEGSCKVLTYEEGRYTALQFLLASEAAWGKVTVSWKDVTEVHQNFIDGVVDTLRSEKLYFEFTKFLDVENIKYDEGKLLERLHGMEELSI